MGIRRANEKDIPALLDLLSQVLMVHHNGRPDLFKGNAVKYTKDELNKLLKDDNKPIFVAEIEGKVSGYAFCIFQQHLNNNILTDIKTLYIDDLCIDKNMRGKGIGKAIFNFVMDFAKENECYNVTLNVWELNEGARKFYEACGFSVQKTGMEKIISEV